MRGPAPCPPSLLGQGEPVEAGGVGPARDLTTGLRRVGFGIEIGRQRIDLLGDEAGDAFLEFGDVMRKVEIHEDS